MSASTLPIALRWSSGSESVQRLGHFAHLALGGLLVLLGLEDLEEPLLHVELTLQRLLVGAHGLEDRLALQVEDLLAGQARAGHEDDEGDIGRPGGDHGRDDTPFAVAHQADALGIDLASRLEEARSRPARRRRSRRWSRPMCSRSSRRRPGHRAVARPLPGGSARRPGPGTACARRSSRRGPGRPSR